MMIYTFSLMKVKMHHGISNLQCRCDENLVAHVNLFLFSLVQNMCEVASRCEFHKHAHVA